MVIPPFDPHIQPDPKTWSFVSTSGLTLQATTVGDGEVFRRFFAGYDKAFVLPEEKEEVDGFRRCLKLNHGSDYARLSLQYGPFREICVIALNESGVFVGGANFIATRVRKKTGGGFVTTNLNYIYVDEALRGRGVFGRLFTAVRDLIGSLFVAPGEFAPVLVFIEQNDPFRMSAEAYRRDSEFTGLDQFDRLRIWGKLGARVVDFPYEQPPLSAKQEADDTLVYSVLGAVDDQLDPEVMEGHLRVFFGVSVLKGADLTCEPTVLSQLGLLRKYILANDPVALLDPMPMLACIRDRPSAEGLFADPPESFRAAIKTFGE